MDKSLAGKLFSEATGHVWNLQVPGTMGFDVAKKSTEILSHNMYYILMLEI